MMNESTESFNTTSSQIQLNPLNLWIIVILMLGTVNFTLMLPSGLWAAWLMMKSPRPTLETEFVSLHLLWTEIISAFIVSCATFEFYFLTEPLLLRLISLRLCMISLHSQPVFQCCVCLERYVAVVHPVIYLRYRPLRYKAAGLGVVWIIAGLLALSGQMSGNFFPLMAILLSIVCVELFCSLSILIILKHNGPGDVNGSKKEDSLVKKRAFIIVSLLQVKLMVNYLPLIVISSVESLITPQLMGDLITLGLTFCFFGSFIQPLMYLHRAGKLKCIKTKK